jgi:hypothetical protein
MAFRPEIFLCEAASIMWLGFEGKKAPLSRWLVTVALVILRSE